MYASSDNVIVYPSTKRTAQRSAKLVTEQSITTMLKNILDVDSYVISNSYEPNGAFEFSISGYYFRVNNLSVVIEDLISVEGNFNENEVLKAYIYIGTTGDYRELYGIDDDSSYTGIVFTKNNMPTATASLDLLVMTDSGWKIPDNSRIKFIGARMNPIDCGEI